MGDMGDYWRDINGASQVKRANNRETSAQYLKAHDILFETKNNGAHLIVEGKDSYIDFWPGTGKWKTRKGKDGFGVKNLVKYIEN